MGVARKGAWMVTGGQRAVGCHTHSQWAGSKVAAGLPQLGGQTAVPADLIPAKNGSQKIRAESMFLLKNGVRTGSQ